MNPEAVLAWIVDEVLTGDDEVVRVDADHLRDSAPLHAHLLVAPLCTYTRSLGFLLLERSPTKGCFRSDDLAHASLISGLLTIYLRYSL